MFWFTPARKIFNHLKHQQLLPDIFEVKQKTQEISAEKMAQSITARLTSRAEKALYQQSAY